MRFLSLRSPISLIAVLVSGVIGLGVATTACTVGDVPSSADQDNPIAYTDDDGDGISDGVDVNGDGLSDFTIEDCPFCQAQPKAVCRRPLIDENNDGVFDGIDRDCDGKIDVRFNTNPGNGGQSARCNNTATINGIKFNATCESATGGGLSCQCSRNDQLVQTCTQASNVCSSSVSNGKVKLVCCVF